jgi:co-chaperonin GroES (HSP10)
MMSTIRPLQDWVCGEPVEYRHKFLYVHGQSTHRAKIVAVGPGKRVKAWVTKQDPLNGRWFKIRLGDETGKVIPTTVKPGDVVEFSDKGFDKRWIDGKEYIFFREASIIGYADDSDPEGMQSHNSAVIKDR